MISDDEGKELLEKWRAGDKAAGERFVREYFGSILAFFRRKLSSDVEVDGLVGRTFELASTTTAPHRNKGSFRSWLLGIARNVLLKALKQKYRDKMNEPLDEDRDTSATFDPKDPAHFLSETDDRRLLLKALRRIPLAQQFVIELRLWEEMSLKDIAEVVGAPEPTVRRRWQLGLEALRVQMKLLEDSPEAFATSTHSLESWIREIKAKLAALKSEGDDDEEGPEGEGG